MGGEPCGDLGVDLAAIVRTYVWLALFFRLQKLEITPPLRCPNTLIPVFFPLITGNKGTALGFHGGA
jgi:hypothetical protein